MPTAALFTEIPPFPEDVPTLDIPTITLYDLEKNNPTESARLFQACREQGFILLDLRESDEGEKMLTIAEKLFHIQSDLFDLDKDVLARYPSKPPRDLTGYKPPGQYKTDDGGMDRTEIYAWYQDDMLGNGPRREHPEPLETNRSLIAEYCKSAYRILSVPLARLNEQLGLPTDTLIARALQTKTSGSVGRMLLTPPGEMVDEKKVTLGGHTDMNILTLLFNVVGGLQVLPAGAVESFTNWRYIRPQEGCAVVNVGDTLVGWTGGILRSSLHRVVRAPGEQASVSRKSLGYFLRASSGSTMQRVKGGVVPPLAEGEEDDSRSCEDWAADRAAQIIRGVMRSETRGGRAIPVQRVVTASA